MNYLDTYRHLPFRQLKVRQATIVDIDMTQSTETDINASFNKAGMINATVGNVYPSFVENKVKLVKLEVDIGDIVRVVNNRPRALGHLIDEGSDARIAHQIFVVMEATLAEKITGDSSLEIGVSNGEMKITADGTHKLDRDITVTLDDGSTFAYALMKPEWDHKKKIEKMVSGKTDQHCVN